MKNRKRNITMVAVLLFVCAAVTLNWSYNQRWGKPDAEMVQAMDEARSSAEAAYNQAVAAGASAYFAEARLTRQSSRDEALNLLQTAATSEAASQETLCALMALLPAVGAWEAAVVTHSPAGYLAPAVRILGDLAETRRDAYGTYGYIRLDGTLRTIDQPVRLKRRQRLVIEGQRPLQTLPPNSLNRCGLCP